MYQAKYKVCRINTNQPIIIIHKIRVLGFILTSHTHYYSASLGELISPFWKVNKYLKFQMRLTLNKTTSIMRRCRRRFQVTLMTSLYYFWLTSLTLFRIGIHVGVFRKRPSLYIQC